MNIKHSKMFVLLAMGAMIFFMGCAHSGSENEMAIIATSEAFKLFEGEYENTAYFKKYKPVSIAVLPFSSQKGKKLVEIEGVSAVDIVRRGMYNHISSLPFKDLELYDVNRLLHNAGLNDSEKIQNIIKNDPKNLKSILGVDAVIAGDVTDFKRVFLGIYSQVAVGCEVKMWDLNKGDLLWRAKNVSRAHGGGVSLSPVGLAMSAVASVWNLRKSGMFNQTDELFREIVSTIELPESDMVSREPGPVLDLFSCMNANKIFTAGSKVAFRVIGDPHCTAYVDIGDFKREIALVPVSKEIKQSLQEEVLSSIRKNYSATGHNLTPELLNAVKKGIASREIYEGHYTVEPGEESYGLMAKAYLVKPSGSRTTELDVFNTLDIDALSPGIPSNISSESLDGKLKISWDAGHLLL